MLVSLFKFRKDSVLVSLNKFRKLCSVLSVYWVVASFLVLVYCLIRCCFPCSPALFFSMLFNLKSEMSSNLRAVARQGEGLGGIFVGWGLVSVVFWVLVSVVFWVLVSVHINNCKLLNCICAKTYQILSGLWFCRTQFFGSMWNSLKNVKLYILI